MTIERSPSIFMGAAILGLTVALSACSSSGTSVGPIVDTGSDTGVDTGTDTDGVVTAILAEGNVSFPDDFVEKTFPFYYAIGDASDGGTASAGIGTARFVSATQIEATIPGQPTQIYDRVGDTDEWTDGNGISFTFADDGALVSLSSFDEAGGLGGAIAYAGFETSVDDRPSVGFYNSNSSGVIFLTAEGYDGVATNTCVDCVDLTADFSRNVISGQVFEGSASFDEGTIAVTNTLTNGSIDGDGFTGNIVSEWEVTPPGQDFSTSQATAIVTNQTVIGRFFGAERGNAAVVYEGDYTVTDGVDTLTGTMSGASDAALDDPDT